MPISHALSGIFLGEMLAVTKNFNCLSGATLLPYPDAYPIRLTRDQYVMLIKKHTFTLLQSFKGTLLQLKIIALCASNKMFTAYI
jgi:hypothetical protein